MANVSQWAPRPAHASGRPAASTSARVLVAATTVLTTWSAQALMLGEAYVRSSLGEPLAVEVGLPAGDRGGMKVDMAPRSAYARHGLAAPDGLGRIRTEVLRKPDGTAVLRITSDQPVNEPILDLLVQASDQSGHLDRQLTLLVNPAAQGQAHVGGTGRLMRHADVAERGSRASSAGPERGAANPRPIRKKRRKKAQRKVVATRARPGGAVRPAAAAASQIAAAAGTDEPTPGPANAGPMPSSASAGASTPAEKQRVAAEPGTAAPVATASDAGATAVEGTPAASETRPTVETNQDDREADPATDGTFGASAAGAPDQSQMVRAAEPTVAPAGGSGRWGIALAAFALLALAGGWASRGRRKDARRPAIEGGQVPGDAGAPAQAATVAVPREPAPGEGAAQPVAATYLASLPGQGAAGAVSEPDPLARADACLAAGRNRDACAVLEGALQERGDDIAILLKLLTIHGDHGDVGRFNEAATRLAQWVLRGRDAWQEVRRRGRELDPSNPLFALPEAASSSGAACPESPAAAVQTAGDEAVSALVGVEQAAWPRAVATRAHPAEEATGVVAEDENCGNETPPVVPREIEIRSDPGFALAATSGNDRPPAAARNVASTRSFSDVDLELVDLVEAPAPSADAPAVTGTATHRARATRADAAAAEEGGCPGTPPLVGVVSGGGVPMAESRRFADLPAMLEQANRLVDDGDRIAARQLAEEAAGLIASLRREAAGLVHASGEGGPDPGES